jgi:hypothetical protein
MRTGLFKTVLIIGVIGMMATACKKEVTKPALKFPGVWNASYTMYSSSFSDDYRVYRWNSKLTINADGTAEAVHQPGNPIFTDTLVTEHLKWGAIDAQTMYLRSLNWSVTSTTMDYRVLEYSDNYIKLDGFDDLSEYWQLKLTK